ncbi:MAG: DUF58 domain-containing protein [Planctomycetes bacterium]|jgi:uncharacterized protein (DUF58 family)|nr:DUF58 domain-containing protein [Planctomycetota bacterium]MCL4729959.1 DUF58 domain-containing protein [Planctomycetota bacterium]
MRRRWLAHLQRYLRRLAVLPVPTRVGWYFFGSGVLLFLAGAYYGENAFVLLACIPLALVLVNLGAAWVNTRGIEFRRELPGHTHAGESVDVGLVVTNRGRLPSFSLELEDTRLADLYRDEPVTLLQSAQAGFLHRVGYTAVFGRRGEHRLDMLHLTSSFPFGLARMTRRLNFRSEIVVYPRPYRLSSEFEQRLLAQARFFGESSASARGQEEVFGVREYLPGQNVARIHWRTTARTGKPMVLELEGRQDASFVLVLDTFPVGDPASLRQRLEQAVGLAAGLSYYLTRQGVLFRFAYFGTELQLGQPGRGDGHYHAIMERLAFAGFAEKPLSEWIDAVGAGGAREVPVLVTLGPKEHAEARLRAPGAFVVGVGDPDYRSYVRMDPLGRRSLSDGELRGDEA